MKVRSLTLRNFRNLQEASFEPAAGLNFLVGQNGQGKTSVLEAIGYLATLRSFRGGKTEEVIGWASTGAEISAHLYPESSPDWDTELKVVFSKEPQGPSGRVSNKKSAFINGKPYRNSSQYLSQRFGQMELGFHTVVFNPSDHDVVRGEPSTRRTYLDRVISAENLEYLNLLQRYQRILEQRNAHLKQTDYPTPMARQVLQGFTEPLVEVGSRIGAIRLEWLRDASPRVSEVAKKIAPNQPKVRVVYQSNWVPEIPTLSFSDAELWSDVLFDHPQVNLPGMEQLRSAFSKAILEAEEHEWRVRSSQVGPHRDDWAFVFGGHLLKGHGSQGEVRTALLALKLTELELFQNRTGQRPLFLLDDFSSELDRGRRSFLMEFLLESPLQVLVTTTEEPSRIFSESFGEGKALPGKVFHLADGKFV